MSPPSRARSGTRRRMGSGSPAREREPTAVEYGGQASGPQPAASGASTSSRARATRRASRPAIAALVTGGSALAASSLSDSEGWRSRSSAAALKLGARASSASALAQRPGSVELRAGRTALPYEIGMVGVRQPVRIGSETGDERALLERQHRLRRPGDGEIGLDRVPALRIGGRMRIAVDDPHPHAGRRANAPHERGAGVERRPDLEVRRARPAERARAEEGTTKVGRPAAGARDDAARGPVEGPLLAREHAGFREDLDRVRRAGDQELRASRVVEGVAPIRANLGGDAKSAKGRERPPRDRRLREIEVERELAAPE